MSYFVLPFEGLTIFAEKSYLLFFNIKKVRKLSKNYWMVGCKTHLTWLTKHRIFAILGRINPLFYPFEVCINNRLAEIYCVMLQSVPLNEHCI